MRNIYVFGNEYIEQDSLAKRLASCIGTRLNIVYCTSPEQILDSEEKEILMLDVVKNIRKPIIIKDASQIKSSKMISLHDFDLGFFLNLMKALGIKKKIKIIGIPPKGNISEIAKEVQQWI